MGPADTQPPRDLFTRDDLPTWDEEIRMRIDGIRSGRVKPIPWAEARRSIPEGSA
jgi:hypothetical protein